MPDFRAFGQPTGQASSIALSRDESHHLVVVNRAKAGDPVIAFDGAGREWECSLQEAHKHAAVLRVVQERPALALPFALTLAQALPKGAAMDGIIRKATEIGARFIQPLETTRTQVHLEGGREDKKLEKWQTAALEAAKQCGNPWVPSIGSLTSLHRWVHSLPQGHLRLVASLHPGAQPLRSVIEDHLRQFPQRPAEITWLIGPEGDFTPEEMALCRAHGFHPVSLGPLVLRCETAATYALSITAYEILARC